MKSFSSTALFLLLLLLPLVAEAFQTLTVQRRTFLSSKNEKHPILLFASKNATTETTTTSKTEETEESLSGLVTGMLQTHREMKKEMAELSALKGDDMPTQGTDGIFRMVNEKQYRNFLTAHADQLVILKFSSPFCKACKMLKQKFRLLHQDPKFASAPVVIGDISVSNNQQYADDPFTKFVTGQLKVHKIPTLHFYVAGELVETIDCGPEGCAWTRLKPQMVDIVEQWRPKLLSLSTSTSNAKTTDAEPEAKEDDTATRMKVETTTTAETAQKEEAKKTTTQQKKQSEPTTKTMQERIQGLFGKLGS